MTYCFDIDGTLCTNTDGSYTHAKPYRDRIDVVNSLYDSGHVILLYTARGATSGIDWRALTEEQLCAWGVRYHTLRLDKPHYDTIIDDKAINDVDFFGLVGT